MPPSSLRVVYAFAREMHPKTTDVFIEYGTAGFRTKASLLEHVVYRMGLLAVIRSRVKNGRTIGIMITASHNLEPDNGVKLIDPEGEMLEQSWEEIATRLANVSDNDLEATTAEVIKQVGADMGLKASVFIGMDTRYTSPRLAAAAVHGVMALKGTAKEFGIVTTPILHYCVRCRNDNTYGTPTEEGYYEKIVGAFKNIRSKLPVHGSYNTTLYVDGANGVGGKKLNIIKKSLDGELDLVLYNLGGNGGKLNLNCGADFVKVSQQPPVGVEHAPFQRVASLDGDGDRLVYYYLDDNNKMHLLDGDKIATLLASYVTELLKACEETDLKLGLVQTAYANGASTRYITEGLKVPVSCVKTGVKHLHHAAQSYDIGVYFEANGHGTVLYSDKAKTTIRSVAQEGEPEQRKAAQLLLNFIDMTNETVGDAISDLFLVETVLCARGQNVKEWMEAYTDLPCRQLKVTVQDRNTISTADAERICTAPEGLQSRIDELVASYKSGRAFVRPSGTEDVVRVYAEADTRENADKLAAQVAQVVFDLAGGVGDRPLVEPEQRKAAQLLLNFIDMTNETVGDAISDLFLVETVLCARGQNVKEWMEAYTDLPCRQLKVTVQDRNTISTADAERICTAPEGLQSRIDELVASYKSGRAFVRPSGTEDVVRVYAEADTRENADKLAAQVAQVVFDLAGGVGDRPLVEPEQRKAAQLLLNFIDMTNETVGDAISDLFLVETVLCARGQNVKEWMEAYTDLPCRQLKVTVQDRNTISTADAERICTAPEGLQSRIDELVASYKSGRAFVRPSGTEDVVRVYAEADTRENADKLAAQVAQVVFDLAGGVGDRPLVEPEQRKAAQLLLNFIDMTNETVGDAISDLFLVETVLCARGQNVKEWMEAYTDLPCRQLKVTVQDRNTISTADAERICTAPEGLQSRIDELVASYKSGRAFVRPSGTEDVVRVYAEADTRENADKLAAQVAQVVFDLAGGVGDRPLV